MALDLVAWINIALPWAGLFAGILVGSLLMIPYRRALKRHKALIIESWFMPPRRFLSLQTRDPQFLSWRVSWPLQVLSLPIFLAFFIGGFHGGMIIISGGCGAYGMLLFTYCERRDIYEEIAKKWRQTVGAASGKEWDGSLGRSAKFLVAGMVLCFVGILIVVSAVLHGIAFNAQEITDSRRSLSETIRDLSVKQVEAGTDSTVAVNPPLESITTE
ncbi:MAG: hypothetical protein HYV26_16350 [Candidatus Hydrogenedentes bacterium]|nr:hypothetical protein [Candidatus Hydrogenedentota bacterium]